MIPRCQTRLPPVLLREAPSLACGDPVLGLVEYRAKFFYPWCRKNSVIAVWIDCRNRNTSISCKQKGSNDYYVHDHFHLLSCFPKASTKRKNVPTAMRVLWIVCMIQFGMCLKQVGICYPLSTLSLQHMAGSLKESNSCEVGTWRSKTDWCQNFSFIFVMHRGCSYIEELHYQAKGELISKEPQMIGAKKWFAARSFRNRRWKPISMNSSIPILSLRAPSHQFLRIACEFFEKRKSLFGVVWGNEQWIIISATCVSFETKVIQSRVDYRVSWYFQLTSCHKLNQRQLSMSCHVLPKEENQEAIQLHLLTLLDQIGWIALISCVTESW